MKEKPVKGTANSRNMKSTKHNMSKLGTVKDKRASNDFDTSVMTSADHHAFSSNPLITNRSMTPDYFMPPSTGHGTVEPEQPFFTFTPPQIISQLMAAKITEKKLMVEIERSV